MNVIEKSQHVSIQLLPNHSINTENELQGFVLSCIENESASVVPFPKNVFAMTSLYEVLAVKTNNQACTSTETEEHCEIDYTSLYENVQARVHSIREEWDYETLAQSYDQTKHHHSQRHGMVV